MSALVYEICRGLAVSLTQRESCLRRLNDMARGMTGDELRSVHAELLRCARTWDGEDAAELAHVIDALTVLAEVVAERGCPAS